MALARALRVSLRSIVATKPWMAAENSTKALFRNQPMGEQA
jgi:hypothetical protein